MRQPAAYSPFAVTPFTTRTARLDHASIDSMVDFYLDKGATGLTVLGMMGEAAEADG